MKKILLTSGIIVFSTAMIFAAETKKYDEGFVVRFLHCLPSSQSLILTSDEGNISISRQITGWSNGIKDNKCAYSEKVTTNNGTKTFSCNFTRAQIDELVSAMKSDPNGNSTAELTWNRYKNIPDVCAVED